MASSSVTVTVKKQQSTENKPDKKEETQQSDSTEAVSDPVEQMTMPLTKTELLSLYDVLPLPINNVVSSKELEKVHKQRINLYQRQSKRTEFFYTTEPNIRPTYMAQALKSQFLEYKKYQTVTALDQRGIIDLDDISSMWQQVHIVDDLIADVLHRMPAQQPVGWQFTSGSKNHLKLPTVGRLRDTEQIADQSTLVSYVLGHFGVMSYTFDRAYFIGHVMGYLFGCYFLAHLSITYGVTPLPQKTVKDYDYATLQTDKMVRLLQSIDVVCKRRIYQLAVFCARLSVYQLDKYIEKMLIAEVNEFNKKQQISHLDALIHQGIMPDS